jgi:hypothetical protein
LWLIGLGGLGCSGKPGLATSPEEAYLQLLGAADADDAARLYDVLDQRTQWAVETVHGAQREMKKLALSTYPPTERDQLLARLPEASDEDPARPRRYFRRLPESATALADAKRRLYLGTGQPVGSVQKERGTADVWREGGSVFHFSRDPNGRWGFAELGEGWERAKERAVHELATVRDNAALYSRKSPVAGEKGTAP